MSLLGIDAQADNARATSGASRTADGDTRDSYSFALGDAGSTRSAGRIWTDKSMSTDDVEFSGSINGDDYAKVELGTDDFLVTYSALATTQEITSLPKVPVDVVYVLDLSGSMNWGTRLNHADADNLDQDDQAYESSRIKAMVEALNTSIDALVKDNPENRIGIVVFNAESSELLPLTTAESISNSVLSVDGQIGNYLEVTSFELYQGSRMEANATVRCNINNESTSTSGGTNIQAGLDLGMSLLADAGNTTFEYEGETYTRIPNVVLMSDGAPTTFASASNAQWQDERGRDQQGTITTSTDIQQDSTVESGSWWSNLGTDAIGSGNVDVAHSADGFMALLTAAYGKNEITNHYVNNAQTAQNADQASCSVYTIGFSTDIQTDSMVAMANMVLNPGENLGQQSDETAIRELNEAWSDYSRGRTTTVSGQIGSSGRVTQYEVARAGDNNNPDSLNYPDQYFMAEDASDLNDAFQQITNAITEAAKAPTNADSNDPVHSGYITYVDTIGDYMVVGGVKELIWAGTEFESAATSDYTGDTSFLPGVGNAEVTKYTFSGLIDSPVYGAHNASEIDIFAYTNTDGNDVLVVRIPASAIPLRVERVGVNSDGSVNTDEQYAQYTGTDDAYPLRLIYSVNLADGVLNADGTINTTVVDASYIQNNLKNGSVDFYTNLYTGGTQDNGNGPETVGNSYVEYTPATDNPFYYVQENTPLFLDQDLSQPATSFDLDETYYFTIQYYEFNVDEDGNVALPDRSPDGPIVRAGNQGNRVTAVVRRTGAEIQDARYTTMVNGQLNLAAGSPRLGYLADYVEDKEANANSTGTAETVRFPTYAGNGLFRIYQGNNGVLSVPYMSKDVQDGSGNSIDGNYVSVGDTLHYVINWTNTTGQDNATITIVDTLPAGVSCEDNDNDPNNDPVYNAENRTLTWTLTGQAADASGSVSFDATVTGAGEGGALENTASVNDVTTNTTVNYVPTKDVDTGDADDTSDNGDTVRVGDVLTYTISYRNAEDAPAIITVADSIPAGTAYVEGSAVVDGVADGTVAAGDVTVTAPAADATTGDITWGIRNVAAGATGTVSFQVRVTEDALASEGGAGSVENSATVQINNDPAVTTNTVQNPVEEPQSLIITKNVTTAEGSLPAPESVTFSFNLTMPGLANQSVAAVKHGAQDESVTLQFDGNGLTTFGLVGGQSIEIPDVAGLAYTVIEQNAANNNGYSLTSVTGAETNNLETATASGTVGTTEATTVIFVNTYSLMREEFDPASIGGGITKQVLGGGSEADRPVAGYEFSLSVKNVSGNGVAEGVGFTLPDPATGTSDAHGAVTFGNIIFTQAGTYEVTVSEMVPNPADDNITYDRHSLEYTVTVAPNGGALVAMVNADTIDQGENVFTNVYTPDELKDVFATDDNGDRIDGSIDGDTVQVGDVLTYTINWVNNATDADGKPVAANVTVTDTVPKGTEFVSADNDIQPDTNGDLSWNLGNQTAGASGTVSFQVRVTEDAVTTDSITNRATIELGNHDPAVEYNTNEVENPVQKGSLSIAKTVTGVGADTSKEFEFTVTASVAGENLEGTYTVDDVDGVNSVDFNGGKATISLKHGETAIIAGLPEGTAYTVTEADYTTDGYTTTKTGDEGTIVANPTAEAAFTNTFDPVDETVDPGSIAGRVNKVLAGGREPGLQEGEFTFEAVVTPTDGSTFDGVTMPAGAEQITEGGAVTGYRLTATNGAAGVDGSAPVAFGDITFAQAGTFHVKVREVVPTGDGADSTINYDDHVFTYDIEVAFDAADGKLVAKVTNTSTADGGATFTNTYNPGDGPQKSVSDEEGTDINNQPVAVGDELTYTISYRNTENQPATIVITDAVPEGTVFVSAENNPTTAPQPDGTGDIAWTIENVPAGDLGEVSFTVRVTEAALQYDKITNTATVQVGNNPSTETNQVENPIEVPEPVKSVSGENGATDGSSVSVGDVLTYTISWTANADYNQVTIRDAAPEHTALVDGSVSAPGAIEGDDIVWRFSNVTSGQTITVSFKVEVLKDASNTTVQNQGMLTIGDNEYTIDTNTVTNPVDPAPTSDTTHISAAKILSGRDWIDNDAFTFELSGVNTDSNDATGFEITTDNPVTVTKEDADAAASDSSSTEGIEVPFGWDVAFTQAGTYQFTVRETSTTPGVTNAAEQTFTVVVSDIKGIEVISEPVSLLFTNTYSPAAGTAGLEAVKTVNGTSKGLEAGAFQFKIEPADGASMPAGPQGGVVSNDVDGRIDFGTFSFSAPGTYAYTVSEVPGTATGYTYDDTVYTVTFTVDDADVTNGTLEVTRAITVDGVPAESVIFSNTYQPQEVTTPAEAPFSGTKSVTNEHGAFELQAGQFSFVMENTSKPAGVETAPVPSEGSTVQNEADGSYSFGMLTFEQPGTYTYKVYEQQGGLAGITYDGTEYVLSFTVEDQDGQLIITSQTVTTANGQASATGMDFANIYNDGQVSVNLGGTKVLETNGFAGASLSEGAYTFVLLDQSGARVARAFNGAPSGNTASFAFDPITYTADDLGTHTYTVVELGADGQPGTGGTDDQRVAHSTQAYTVTVTVSADEQAQGDGALKADVAIANADGDASSMEFTNSYEPTPGTVGPNGSAQIAGTKELAGRALNAGEFTFELLQGDEVIDQATNNADGSFAFGKDLTFKAEGTYVYAVREAAGTLGGVTYDDALYTVVITVMEDTDAHALVPTVAYQLDGEDATGMTFSNTYEAAPAYAQLGVAKMLENADLVDGQFSFELAAATEGAPMPEQTKATNAANGAVSFGQVVYTEPGEYDYTVTEINDGQEGIAYDEDTTRTIHVSVTDNGQGSLVATVSYGDEGPVFVNTANPDEPTESQEPTKPQEPGQPEQPAEPSKPEAPSENLPVTGDYLPMVAGGAVLVAIALVAGGVVIRRKQR